MEYEVLKKAEVLGTAREVGSIIEIDEETASPLVRTKFLKMNKPEGVYVPPTTPLRTPPSAPAEAPHVAGEATPSMEKPVDTPLEKPRLETPPQVELPFPPVKPEGFQLKPLPTPPVKKSWVGNHTMGSGETGLRGKK